MLPAVDGLYLGETITPRRWDGSKLINLPSPKMKTGTYVGNGQATQAITGVGFKPKMVMIHMQAEGALDMGVATESDIFGGYQYTKYMNNNLGVCAYDSDHVRSLDDDGFTVGDGTGSANAFNISLLPYTYVAFG